MVYLLPEQCRAARGLLDWTQEQLAERAGVSRSTIRDFECHRHTLQRATEALVIKAFEGAGIILLPPDRDGPGVRLRRAKETVDVKWS
ncbi:MAG TPA: helix-turn-helix domain-containing protein [Microvirga sp.]|nr:helix-turn-helix domain-containing protein [Microvirga sp.]